MRILFISQGIPFPIYRDGLTLRLYHLLKAFSESHECHLIAFSDRSLDKGESAELRRYCSYELVPFERTSLLCNTVRKVVSYRRYYSKRFARVMQRAIEYFGPEILFVEPTFMAQYVDVQQGIPSVLSAVDAISLAARKRAEIPNRWLVKLAWRYVAHQRLVAERRLARRCDGVSVVAAEDALFLEQNVAHKIHVIPNGVDTEFFYNVRSLGRRNSICFSGNLAAPMNDEACQYLLEEVFPQIHAARPDLRLIIAGRSPGNRLIRSLPRYVDLQANVPDMRLAMRDCLLYLSPIQYGTGIKNNVLQAMAMGLPVLVTPLIAKPIGIRDGELGFVAERGTLFLEKLDCLLSDSNALMAVGDNARSYVESNFSWRAMSRRYEALFSSAVAKRVSQHAGVSDRPLSDL